ncbi:hypothetical protein LCGC14_2696490 [marine sediment metagenome]|uniref:Capsid protein n=1 Tax=marine sediment metagenome TaxID=412755 RepID=A0A0F8ZGX9_9ZZZZ
MASLINLAALTINEQEALLTSEAIFEKVYAKPVLTDAHLIATGIQMKTQIPFYGLFGMVGKKAAGSCNVNAETKAVVASEKFWDPMLINFRLTHCQEDINQLFKMWKRAQSALATWEDMVNDQVAFLADRVADATLEAILRITSFADTSEDVVGSGGNLTAGTTITYFTMLDGLWNQLIAGVAASTVPRYTIPENGGASYAAQDNLAADRALIAMRKCYNNLDTRARQVGDLKYQMTDSLFKNWLSYLEDKSLAFTLQRTEEGKGTDRYTYRGIPIVVRFDWDRNIRASFDTGAKYYLPHRLLLGPINNVPIGTSDESDMQNMDMFYDRTDKKHYSDVAFYIDCKLLENYLAAVAY